jgi:fructose-specific phosphotransferase system IIC component
MTSILFIFFISTLIVMLILYDIMKKLITQIMRSQTSFLRLINNINKRSK